MRMREGMLRPANWWDEKNFRKTELAVDWNSRRLLSDLIQQTKTAAPGVLVVRWTQAASV